jgi:NADPH:quinone reductase-like Zn-dependent oxidoreductase
MRSVWIPKAGPPEVRESADSTPLTGQVLVRAAGVNFADVSALGLDPDAPPVREDSGVPGA